MKPRLPLFRWLLHHEGCGTESLPERGSLKASTTQIRSSQPGAWHWTAAIVLKLTSSTKLPKIGAANDSAGASGTDHLKLMEPPVQEEVCSAGLSLPSSTPL